MKVSKLIEDLQKLQAEHGDLEVIVIDEEIDVYSSKVELEHMVQATYYDFTAGRWEIGPAIVMN